MKGDGPFHENQVFIFDDEINAWRLRLSPRRVEGPILTVIQDGRDFRIAGLVLLTGVTSGVDQPKLKFRTLSCAYRVMPWILGTSPGSSMA